MGLEQRHRLKLRHLILEYYFLSANMTCDFVVVTLVSYKIRRGSGIDVVGRRMSSEI